MEGLSCFFIVVRLVIQGESFGTLIRRVISVVAHHRTLRSLLLDPFYGVQGKFWKRTTNRHERKRDEHASIRERPKRTHGLRRMKSRCRIVNRNLRMKPVLWSMRSLR